MGRNKILFLEEKVAYVFGLFDFFFRLFFFSFSFLFTSVIDLLLGVTAGFPV